MAVSSGDTSQVTTTPPPDIHGRVKEIGRALGQRSARRSGRSCPGSFLHSASYNSPVCEQIVGFSNGCAKEPRQRAARATDAASPTTC